MAFRGSRRRSAQVIRRRVARMLSGPAQTNLTALAVLHGTDKWGRHRYTGIYADHFARFRDLPITLLEIGVGGHRSERIGGASLRMWKSYFARGQIIGVDIVDKTALEEPRIHIVQGDQSDSNFLDRLGSAHGPFDIVIDDGSHQNDHVISTFEALFPHVRIGGIYAIEDTQTAYWPRFGGDDTDLNSTKTSMGYLKRLVDGLNWAERSSPDPTSSPFATAIAGLHFYHNLVFIDKGINDSPGGDPQAD